MWIFKGFVSRILSRFLSNFSKEHKFEIEDPIVDLLRTRLMIFLWNFFFKDYGIWWTFVGVFRWNVSDNIANFLRTSLKDLYLSQSWILYGIFSITTSTKLWIFSKHFLKDLQRPSGRFLKKFSKGSVATKSSKFKGIVIMDYIKDQQIPIQRI